MSVQFSSHVPKLLFWIFDGPEHWSCIKHQPSKLLATAWRGEKLTQNIVSTMQIKNLISRLPSTITNFAEAIGKLGAAAAPPGP